MTEPIQVLLLDDEPIVGKRLKPALPRWVWRWRFSRTRSGALSRVARKEFNIVVTDIRMDDIDGMQVLEFVRDRWPQCKVIMITGYAMMSLAREAMEKGAFDFIAKPFKPDDLREVISKAARALGHELAMPAGADGGN